MQESNNRQVVLLNLGVIFWSDMKFCVQILAVCIEMRGHCCAMEGLSHLPSFTLQVSNSATGYVRTSFCKVSHFGTDVRDVSALTSYE